MRVVVQNKLLTSRWKDRTTGEIVDASYWFIFQWITYHHTLVWGMFILAFLMMFVLLFFFLHHIYLVLKNTTTNERSKRGAIVHAIQQKKKNQLKQQQQQQPQQPQQQQQQQQKQQPQQQPQQRVQGTTSNVPSSSSTSSSAPPSWIYGLPVDEDDEMKTKHIITGDPYKNQYYQNIYQNIKEVFMPWYLTSKPHLETSNVTSSKKNVKQRSRVERTNARK